MNTTSKEGYKLLFGLVSRQQQVHLDFQNKVANPALKKSNYVKVKRIYFLQHKKFQTFVYLLILQNWADIHT